MDAASKAASIFSYRTFKTHLSVPLWFKPKSVIRPFFEYLCLLSVL